MISRFSDIKFIRNSRTERRNQSNEIVSVLRMRSVSDFSTLRIFPRAEELPELFGLRLFGRTSGGISLDDVDLAQGGIFLAAIRKFSGHAARFPMRFSAD
jgi:hypothetical protein